MTAKWEAYLRKIGNGEGSPKHFIATIAQFINKLISEVPNQLNIEGLNNKIITSQEKTKIALCPTYKKGTVIQWKSY